MRYRNVATIEATQFDPSVLPWPAGVYSKGPEAKVYGINTLEGPLTVTPGDWIATGAKGEHWPIKPDVFAATYVPCGEEVPT